MAIYFLDVDDEITSAAARIRDSADSRIALVLSGGSRVATSRINFRLLAREAQHRHKRLAIVAPDQSVRSVAQSAGLPVFATVSEYEKSEAARAATGAAGSGEEVSATLDELAATITPGATPAKERPWSQATRSPSRVVGAGGASVSSGPSSSARAAGRDRRSSGVPRAALALAAVVLLVLGAVGLAIFWPSAHVVLTVAEVPVGPISMTVKVDPGLTSSNDATAAVPGVTKAFPVSASSTFKATGQNVVDTAATGTVTFRSIDTIQSVPVIAGTQVTTDTGIAFITTQTVTVPKATVSGSTITRGRVEAPVTAVKKGTAGNVAAGAIVNVPTGLSVFGVAVSNSAPTTGGTHVVTPAVQQADIDAAEASLMNQLDAAFQAKMADPTSAPAGFDLFPKTARLGDAIFTPDPASLLNQGVASFQLGSSATGTATVADLDNVRNLAERTIMTKVKKGYTLVDNSVTVVLGTAVAAGDTLSVPVTARASQIPIIDTDALKKAITGESVADAKAFLGKYGKVDITLSPGWGGLPGFDFRIDIEVVVPPPHATPTPTKRPSGGSNPTPVTQPTGSAGTGGPSSSPSEGPSPTESAAPPSPSPIPTDTPVPTPAAT
jgi:hypothetical protein